MPNITYSDPTLGTIELLSESYGSAPVIYAQALRLAGASGALVAASVANGVEVDVTRLPGLAAGIRSDAVFDGAAAVTIKRVNMVVASSGVTSLIAAVSAKRFRVFDLIVVQLALTNSFNLQDSAGTPAEVWATATNRLPVDVTGATGPGGYDHGSSRGLFQTPTVNTALNINTSSVNPLMVSVVYAEVD